MVEFNNGIFHTTPHESIEGCWWLVETATGEKIIFARRQFEIEEAVGELMKQRIAALQGLTRKSTPSRQQSWRAFQDTQRESTPSQKIGCRIGLACYRVKGKSASRCRAGESQDVDP